MYIIFFSVEKCVCRCLGANLFCFVARMAASYSLGVPRRGRSVLRPSLAGEVENGNGSEMFVMWCVVAALLFIGAVIAAVLKKKKDSTLFTELLF